MKFWMMVVACLFIGHLTAQQPSGKPISYLGVGVTDIDQDRAKVLKLPEVRGVEINIIADGSPASKAGLLKGDVVFDFNGQRVEGTDQFMRLVRETPAGHKVTLQIIRNGSAQTVTSTVGARSGIFSSLPAMPAMPAMPAVPAMPAMPAIPAMPAMSRTRLMWTNGALGVEAEPLSGQLADYFGVKEGVLVRSVAKDSPAEKAGLKAGDVILKVDGEEVTTPSEISSEMHSSNSKRAIPFNVVRNHHELTMNVADLN